MSRRGVVRAVCSAVLGIAALTSLAACGDDDNAVDPRGNDAGDSGDAGAETSVNFPDAAGVEAGAFSVVDVANTPCVARGGAIKEVYAADATTYRPLRMVAVGTRRAMQIDNGFVLMDADGSNASALPVTAPFEITSLASTSTHLFGLGGTTQTLQAARFDAVGTAGPPIGIAVPTGGSAVGGGEGTALVAWIEGSSLRAAAFTSDGAPAAPPFYFRQSLAETEATVFDVVHAGGNAYGVAFAGQGSGTNRLVFTRVNTSQRVGTSFTLLNGPALLKVVQMARTASGFALLIERRLTAAAPPETIVVLLDADGRFARPALRLLGVRRAFGVASSGGEIGVLAWRTREGSDTEPEPDAIEFRSFDAMGTPLGSWVCLDAPFTAPTLDIGAAILGEDNGYSVLMRTPSHAVSLTRFNRIGTGG